MELMFIEKLIADYKMEFIENREDREILQKFKEKAKKLLDDKVSTRKIYKIELIEEES
jgi:triphosphoribosyl-dephospho-CoA synthetase